MAKNEIQWETVSFGERHAPMCELTFRPSGQIVFGTETLASLAYPRFIHLMISPANSLIAIKAADTADGDAIQLTTTQLIQGEPRTISGKKVYRWICGLMGQEEGRVLIRLAGELNQDGMVVFDVKRAALVPKRTHKRRAKAEE